MIHENIGIDYCTHMNVYINIYTGNASHHETYSTTYHSKSQLFVGWEHQIPLRHAWVAKEALDGLTVTKEPMEQLSPPVTFPAG